jgi:RimJ/RimL family protein N-acetyltransferase
MAVDNIPQEDRGSVGMIKVMPVVLERGSIRLEPLDEAHVTGLVAAATDGELWTLWFTAVPAPHETEAYVASALRGQKEGHMLPWAVRDLESGAIVGSTRYHDIVAGIGRVEIGYTWYAKSRQKSNVNTTCKLMLLSHAFDTLGCEVVGFRTDNFNFESQRAIEALGAKKDGIVRHYMARRDGMARDTHIYSILAGEWPDVKRHLELRLERRAAHN